MKKIFILLFFIMSISFSQVVPIEVLDGINIDEIPQNIPSINSDELNVSFNENAISIINSIGNFSYLIIDSNFDGNYQMKINHANFPKDAYLVFFDRHLNCLYGPYNTSNGEISGISHGIDNDGALKLKTAKEMKKIFVGDVVSSQV